MRMTFRLSFFRWCRIILAGKEKTLLDDAKVSKGEVSSLDCQRSNYDDEEQLDG